MWKCLTSKGVRTYVHAYVCTRCSTVCTYVYICCICAVKVCMCRMYVCRDLCNTWCIPCVLVGMSSSTYTHKVDAIQCSYTYSLHCQSHFLHQITHTYACTYVIHFTYILNYLRNSWNKVEKSRETANDVPHHTLPALYDKDRERCGRGERWGTGGMWDRGGKEWTEEWECVG